MNNKIIYIGFAFKHHKNTHAGYHHIKEYINYDKIIDCQWEHEFLCYKSKFLVLEILRRVYIKIFGSGANLHLIYAILLNFFYRNTLFHFIYAENNYRWFHAFKHKTNRIICTYHQPYNDLIKNPKWFSGIDKVDLVILMSENDVNNYKRLTNKNNVICIPHGINTNFYFPTETSREKSVLIVGNWLRDFSFAESVIDQLLETSEDLTINLVINKANMSKYIGSSRVNYFSHISDEALRDLYQNSGLLFLPLFAFTANNAVLEAAACGCPIIISCDNFDETYFSSNQILFTEKNNLVYNEILRMLSKSDNCSENIVAYVNENFSWEVIGKKTNKVFNNVLSY